MRFFAIATAMFAICSIATAAPVYRWKDRAGNYTFSDRPIHPSAEIFTSTDPASSKTEELTESELRRSQKCAAAQAEVRRYETYDTILVVSDQEGGQRELTKGERERAVASAKQDVEVWCNRAAPPQTAEPEAVQVEYGDQKPASPDRLDPEPGPATSSVPGAQEDEAAKLTGEREAYAAELEEELDAMNRKLDALRQN